MSKGNRTRRKAAGLLPEPQQCTAHKKNGSRCKKYAINGANVCGSHGGRAPQVRAKAEARLASHADALIRELLRIAMSAESEAVRLAAVRDALDRIGITADRRLSISVEAPPWLQDIEGLMYEGDDVVDAEVVEDEDGSGVQELDLYGNDWQPDPDKVYEDQPLVGHPPEPRPDAPTVARGL